MPDLSNGFRSTLDTWSDGENWHFGHWLTGRLGSCSLEDLVSQILEDYEHEAAKVQVNGLVDGYAIPEVVSARQAIEPLLGLFDINALEEAGELVFQDNAHASRCMASSEDIIQEGEQPQTTGRRFSEVEMPAEAVVFHASVFSEYEERATKSRRIEGG